MMEETISGHLLCSNWIPTKLQLNEISDLLNLEKGEICTFREGLFRVHTNERRKNPNTLLISPTFNDWRLIMGCQLGNIQLSKIITEKLSLTEKESFSFGIDTWCAYYFWMHSENGQLKKYFFYNDDEIETEGESQYEELVSSDQYEDCVFKLSKEIGFDMDQISLVDLKREAMLFQFSYDY